MKVGQTYIEVEAFEKVLREEGMKVERQAGFLKCTRPGNDKQILYVANGKSVARCDLSGFRIEGVDDVFELGGEKYGRVHQRLRFDRPRDDVLGSFRKLCKGLGSWPEVKRKERARPVGLKGSKKKEITTVVNPVIQAEETPKQTVDRLVAELANKRALAKKVGGNLSKKTEAEYLDKIAAAQKLVIDEVRLKPVE
jgi:hypothetical protein